MTGSVHNLITSTAVERWYVAANRLPRYRNVLLLALAAPAIAELLSSSAPPLEFFIPWIFALFVLFYGGSVILIREVTLRWNSGWPGILLLGAAFGILEEGISTRAFFDPAWSALGPMTGTGYWLGVNWTWMFDAIFYHAVFSTALPILLVYQIFPQYRRITWLGTRGLTAVSILFAFAAAVFVQSGTTRYPAPAPYLLACLAAIVILALLSRKLKVSPRSPGAAQVTRARPFAILAFGATLGLVLQIYALPLVVHSAWVTAAALALLVLVPAWLLLVWSGGELTNAQSSALLIGALGCFAVLGFLQEINPTRTNNPRGMSIVSAGTLIGLYFLRKKTWAAEPVRLETIAAHSPAIARTPSIGGPVEDAVIPREAGVSPFWRLFEVVTALTALILASPIVLILAIIIRRGSPGRALFFQPRVGINGRVFTFVKFRTLYADAKQRFPELYAYQYSEEDLRALKFKIVNDPRVTPQGKWMRTTTLDELPNFWNVLRGEMALVGPRPEIPEMLPYYKGEMLRKFSVRPGVTGLAQISGRGRLGFHETVELDVEYVKSRSTLLDLKIIALTVYKMVTRDGAF
jgi:lipopolysaccharide/colanic/teichoic acid biosynthesis glycosyltransferase